MSAGRDADADALAAEALAREDPTGWFERLYAAAARGEAVVPWARHAPRVDLVAWAERTGLDGHGRRALVVGAGLGDDAAFVAAHGYATTAFDIAATAVRSARERFPDAGLEFVVANLLDLPAGWQGAFDLVVEIFTVQSLPEPPRREAIGRVGPLVAPGGTLLVIASARDERDGPVSGPPWPLVRDEVDAFAIGGLTPVEIEELREAGRGVHLWRAEFRRATSRDGRLS